MDIARDAASDIADNTAGDVVNNTASDRGCADRAFYYCSIAQFNAVVKLLTMIAVKYHVELDELPDIKMFQGRLFAWGSIYIAIWRMSIFRTRLEKICNRCD